MSPIGIDIWPFTIAHFVVMAVFAGLAVMGILWGMKLKRRRRQAEEDFDAHRRAADAAPAEPEVAEDLPPAPPVVPAPPLGDPTTAAPTSPPPARDITQLKGLGPKLAATLSGLGITSVDQIAAMSPAELDAFDAQLGAFKGRPARDRWAEQARLLTAGDKAAYEAEFGKLGG